MIEAIIAGTLLGLSGGLTPGPLLTLVLAQTLQHGPKEGCRIAMAPLLTDLPIILLALALAAELRSFHFLLGLLCFAGGGFILYLALESWRLPAVELKPGNAQAQSWRKGVLTNLLNPSPWMFWLTAGSTTLSKMMAKSNLAAAAFLACFYLCLVGSKVALAMVAGQSRQFLQGATYRWVLRALAFLLAIFALSLIWDGMKQCGLLNR